MDSTEWALWSLAYLKEARAAIHDDFNHVMSEVREYHLARNEAWYPVCKSIAPSLYHYSIEFTSEIKIPSSTFASPQEFARKLSDYQLFVETMIADLNKADQQYQERNKGDGPPFLVNAVREQVAYIAASIEHVLTKKPVFSAASTALDNVGLIAGLARRFHESVLSLSKHPHGGPTLKIANEWDCQYLFRSILAAYFNDIRDEEWNPSVAGSSARCEFFLKSMSIMVELKYVRKASDLKKIKTELATDFIDYGGNQLVNHAVCLVYDPSHALTSPVALQKDLSGPRTGLQSVLVVVSPPRDT